MSLSAAAVLWDWTVTGADMNSFQIMNFLGLSMKESKQAPTPPRLSDSLEGLPALIVLLSIEPVTRLLGLIDLYVQLLHFQNIVRLSGGAAFYSRSEAL